MLLINLWLVIEPDKNVRDELITFKKVIIVIKKILHLRILQHFRR